MYYRPAGFVTDQQIWMVGVLVNYFLKSVMHFSHDDFMTALKVDLGPILGECGLWVLKNYEMRMADKGRDEKKKKPIQLLLMLELFILMKSKCLSGLNKKKLP